MKKNNLSKTGLSISQAQSISNAMNQKAQFIASQLSNVNNSQKTISVNEKEFNVQKPSPLPDNLVDLLTTKSQLHAVQAFLMENLKAKDSWIKSLKRSTYLHPIKEPALEKVESPVIESSVEESWGWEKLTSDELNEFYEAEAFASHVGQFIHSGGTLSELRRTLPKEYELTWITQQKESYPVKVEVHHKEEDLLEIHEQLSKLHMKHEKRVNYFKAKVNNLVSSENIRISSENKKREKEYLEKWDLANKKFHSEHQEWFKVKMEKSREFESENLKKIKEVSSYRISVDPRFKKLVDSFLEATEKGEEGNSQEA